MPKENSKLKAADPWLKWPIIAGTATYFAEVTTGISEGNSGHSVFWWVQSFIAVCFTVEYILRWVDDAHDQYRWHIQKGTRKAAHSLAGKITQVRFQY